MDLTESDGNEPIGSKWWRFDQYEVVGGTHIAPAEDAKLICYDPFEAHEEMWGGRGRGDEPAYLKLARLDPIDVEELLDWCSEYGLLGVLPHRTRAVHFWPVWGQARQGGAIGSQGTGFDDSGPSGQHFDAEGAHGSGPVAEQQVYRWGQGGGWDTVSAPVSRPEESRSREGSEVNVEERGDRNGERFRDLGGEKADAPVESSGPQEGTRLRPGAVARVQGWAFWQYPPLRRPSAQIRRLNGASLEEVSFAEGYAQFFPRRPCVTDWVAGHYDWPETPGPSDNPFLERPQSKRHREAQQQLEQDEYPAPHEEAFLREYGEPIPLLKAYAWQVQAIYEEWEEASGAETFEELEHALGSMSSDVADQPPFEEFRASLQVVSPNAVPRREGDGYRWPLSWHIPSLYAGLNVMMLQDFTQRDVTARRCLECNRRYTTTRTDTKYCGPRCGNRHRVRRHREKSKEEEK